MYNNEEVRKPLVFLGGTWNDSTWRDRVIQQLTIDYYNPIIKDRPWTPEDARIENHVKSLADILLFVITPLQHGFYSIAELTYAACKTIDRKVIIAFINEDDNVSFTVRQSKSNAQIVELLKNEKNVTFANSIQEVVEILNNVDYVFQTL